MNRRFCSFILSIFLLGCTTHPLASTAKSLVDETPLWQSWQEGDFSRLQAGVDAASPSDETEHLQLLLVHITGQYIKVYDHFQKISPSYSRYAETLRPTIDSLIHLGHFQEALDIVNRTEFRSHWYRPILESLIQRPIILSTKRKQRLMFTKGSSLDPYMPAIEGELKDDSGKTYSGPIRIDTGGEFLHVSKKRAEELGLKEIACQQGKQAENKTQVCWSQIDLQLGTISGKNIPILIIYSLPDAFDPILGTNVFQRFKTEINYPKSELTLYPKDRAFPPVDARCDAVPFYMWADHYMFAKGRLGDTKNLNFFIDTGLVAVASDRRQAAIKVATEDLKSWGIEFSEADKIFDPKRELGVGSTLQSGHLVIHSPLANVESNFGGVRVHGLLGHAFYKMYLWRIDFDKRVFDFCQ